MNKMWLAVLLIPYMGFAQTSQEGDFSEDALSFEETPFSAVGEDVEEPKRVACNKGLGAYEKEPSFCAYCGASLIVRSDEDSTVMDNSAQVASADKSKGSSVKRRSTPAIGAKSSAVQSKVNEDSDRPRVTQRKKGLGPQTDQNKKPVSSSQPSSSSEVSKREQAAPETESLLEGREGEDQSAQIEKKTATRNSNRPKVTQRKQLSSVDQNVKKGRFSEREQETSSVAPQRPCAQVQKQKKIITKERGPQEKRSRAVAKRSSEGSKSQIRESMFSRSTQED